MTMRVTKAELSLAEKMTGESRKYTINGIGVDATHTVATNGYTLVAVAHPPHPRQPQPQCGEGEGEGGKTVILSREGAMKAAKSIPRCAEEAYAEITEGGAITLSLNGKEGGSEDTFTVHAGREGLFPNWRGVLFTLAHEPIGEIYLNAFFLNTLLDYITAFPSAQGKKRKVAPIRLTFYGPDFPMKIDGHVGEGQPLVAMIMSMRGPFDGFPETPKPPTPPETPETPKTAKEAHLEEVE